MRASLSFSLVLFSITASTALAAVKTEKVEYKDAAGAVLEGVIAYDDAVSGRRPGVVVVHDWMGISETTEMRVRELALLGYVAFAADIYGKGARPKDGKEARALAGKFKGDRKLLRGRAQAALEALTKDPHVDASKLAAIGFCFGGTTALELAKSGAPLKGTVSFHGGLDAVTPGESRNIKGKVLVLHGADDPHVAAADIAAFRKDLDDAKVDWTMVQYSGTVHSFTVPTAGSDTSKGSAYNERSSRRAFAAMKAFFDEIFGAT
ncbi:MAG: dienelactone hydrolase family protein [Deltaproteobacteria bacterium]|nr:dienelactone hydrolase family protein [Deltaproteobacteria bacterium]